VVCDRAPRQRGFEPMKPLSQQLARQRPTSSRGPLSPLAFQEPNDSLMERWLVRRRTVIALTFA